jgi:intracellular multiplication protein IcmK
MSVSIPFCANARRVLRQALLTGLFVSALPFVAYAQDAAAPEAPSSGLPAGLPKPAAAEKPPALPSLGGPSSAPKSASAAAKPASSSGLPSASPAFLPPSSNEALGYDNKDTFDFEKSPEDLEEEARRQAFDAALQGLLPMRPGEIRELLEHFDRTQESVEVPVYPNPKPEVTVQTISLDPGAQPVTVKVAHGHVTTLNVLDASGAPWPIEDISWAGNFEVIESSASGGSHIIRISPSSEFAYGNMSIRLLTLKTPVIVTLETSRDIVHYRFDAIIPEYGPVAEIPLIDTGLTISAGGDQSISSVLEGIAPEASEKLSVEGVDGRTSAYRLDGMTYLRTPHTLLSPGWSSSVSSADGTHVYAIEDTPVIILSDKGRMVRARLSDREELLDE